MRTFSRLAAVVLLIGSAFAVAADPPPLVAPVNPGNATRVRLPMVGKSATSVFKAQIPKPKTKGEFNDITLHVETLSSGISCTIQQWKAWGFDVPADRNGKLPELIIPGLQSSGKPAKGRDVEYKLTDVRVSLYEAPGGEKGGITNALTIPLSVLTAGADRAREPRVHFADRFIELTAPTTKKLNTGPEKLADLQVTTGDKLLPAHIPMNGALFTHVSVNGRTQYKRATGKVEAVAGGLQISGGSELTMSVNIARGCDVELDKEAGPTRGKVKELRFGPITGPGVKGEKDFVLKDVTVAIHDDEDSSFVWVGSEFVAKYFADGVYACEPSGAWKLHGRVRPEHLADQKGRGK